MTLEEKLELFSEHSMEAARKKANEQIQSHQTALDTIFEEHKTTKERQTALELSAEKDRIQKENNKLLSSEQLQIKRLHSLKTMELEKKLFHEVKEKLKAFKASPDYIPYLCRKIREAAAFAGNTETNYYIDASDSTVLDDLIQASGVSIQVSPTSFLGGLQAIIPDKQILIDYSFASMLKEERNAFSFERGLGNE